MAINLAILTEHRLVTDGQANTYTYKHTLRSYSAAWHEKLVPMLQSGMSALDVCDV